ncbi:Berberine bridge enzyme-like 21 [Linum perenne]
MNNRPTFVLVPFLLLLLVSAAATADNSSVYQSFLLCLEKNTPPEDKISDLVYSPANQSFTSVLEAYIRNSRLNTTTTPKPSIIITATKIPHVQAAVICTKAAGFQLKIRSGGHDYEGISYVSDYPFFILDMFNLRSIQIDAVNQSGWVQAGATLGELYYAISQKSNVLGFPAGVCPTYGNLLRKYGLSVDHIVDAQIVDAEGNFLDSRESMGEDMFWAIRGGGGASFGVVIAYKIKLVPVPATVTVFRVEKYLEDNATDMVYQWQFVAPKTTNDLFMRNPISKAGLEWIWKKMIETGKTGLVFNPYGGRMDEIGATETPFPHRKGNLWKMQYSIGWKEGGETAEREFQIRRIYGYMTRFVSKNPRRAYLNYRDLDIGTEHPGKDRYEEGKVYGEKYFGENFERLVKVKTAVDPNNFFWNEQSIPVLPK